MMTKKGKPKKSELPSTVARSGKKARRTFAKAHDSAAKEYGEGERAMRTAWSALKHTHEKVGDHWQRKDKKGPSDAQAKGGKNTNRKTAGGVDANATKKHLYEVAKELDIEGRSKMSKKELVKAIQKENDRRTRKARG
ncbi:MAG: ChaB family protein [Candidatus Nanopelagicales bacterium]